ncbi:MAG: Trk system potassium transporter TrkA [Polyangiaceae bacterium]|nr:Trk system potassium transporter TrkA [Polyangiaceae bacterium]
MNIVIAGADVVAYRLAEQLMGNHQVICAVPTEAAVESFHRLDVQIVRGPVTSRSVLEEARTAEAGAFVASTDNDEQNIVACLAAQSMGAARTICVLQRPGFFSTEDADALDMSLGIDQVVRPAEHLADEIIRIVTVPGALDVELFLDGRVELLRYAVEEGAEITQAPLKSLKLPRQVVLISIRRGDALIVPTGETHIRPGDKITAMGRRRSIQRLSRTLRRESSEASARTAAIVGAGTVGVAVAKGLREAGWQVKLLESDRDRCERVAAEVDALVLHGDGADLELLQQERFGESAVAIAVTNNDEKNLLVSLLAKHLGVRRIVTRADRLSNERMFEKVGVDVVRSAHGAAIRTIVRSIDESNSEIRAELEHGEACVIELTLPKGFPAIQLRDLRPPSLAVVGAIVRARRLMVPAGTDVIRAGDHVLIFCDRANEEKTRDFFMDADAVWRQLEGK